MSGSDPGSPLEVVKSQLAEATRAKKCHPCGCLHKTVEALEGTGAGAGPLAEALAAARGVFKPKKYDCLGCATCFPALAANAFSEAFPAVGSSLDLCPTDEPQPRAGWPILPGDYSVVRFAAPVAVCTLASDSLSKELAAQAPEGIAIVGTLQTENLGIERIIRNILSNPNIRFLLVCGEDSQRQVGHLAGQSLLALSVHGVDEKGRIRGAAGKRPFLKNISREQVAAFLRQVEFVPMLGETGVAPVLERVADCAIRDPGPFVGAPQEVALARLEAREPERLVSDPAGYLVVYPDRGAQQLSVEHYTNAGVLDCIVSGPTSTAVYCEIIARGLVSRLDHAAYLGRELARAELNIAEGRRYVQDRAPGAEVEETSAAKQSTACACPPSADAGPVACQPLQGVSR